MKSIQWKFVLIYILLLVFALELFGVYMLSSVEKHFTEDLQKGLHNQVRLISLLAERYFAPQPDSAGLQQLIKQYSNVVGREIY